MSIRRSAWTPGIPCWVDLTTVDLAASGAFYAAVLGWSVPAADLGQGRYLVMDVRGAAVAGMLRPLDGAPSGWTVHLATDDADASVAAALDRGAKVRRPAGDIGALGRRAVLLDPQGAAFGYWQGTTLIGSQLVDEPGGLCWEELRSPDPAEAVGFYDGLFRYAFEPEPAYGPDYTSFRLVDEPVGLGGVRAVGDEPVPAGWLPFFGVHDAETAARLTLEHGGSVLVPTYSTPRDEVACLADPAGNAFCVLSSTGKEQPDRSG